MRAALLYNPLLLLERVGIAAQRTRRLRRLRGTVAARLKRGHIDSLELLELLGSNAPSTIYDIGANVGTWTLLAKAVFPQASVHAFEPLAGHLQSLDRNLRGVPNVSVHPVALGTIAKRMDMKVAEFSDASSLLDLSARGTAHPEMRSTRSQLVQVVPLDDYARELSLPPPDLIKLDVQGYELEVLRGAAISMRNATAILTEVSFLEYYTGQCLFEPLVQFTADNGFRLAAFGYGTALGANLTQTDVLFLRR